MKYLWIICKAPMFLLGAVIASFWLGLFAGMDWIHDRFNKH